MATPTESHAWRSILGLLIPAAVLGTALGLLQAGVFGGRTPSTVADGEDTQRAPAAPGVKAGGRGADQSAMAVADDLRPQAQPAMQDLPTAADVDELAEEAALQQALAQEHANGG